MNLIPPEIDVVAEWLRTFEDKQRFEWVDGQPKERPPIGAEANRVNANLIRILDDYATVHQLGLVFTSECSYKIFPSDPKNVRKPDRSFIARVRLPNDRPPRGPVSIPPDLGSKSSLRTMPPKRSIRTLPITCQPT